MSFEDTLKGEVTAQRLHFHQSSTTLSAAILGLALITSAKILAEAIKHLSDNVSHSILPGDPRDLL